jgi:pyruvate dehydrogenase E1 component beta subunit
MLAEFGEKKVIDPIAELGFTGIAVGSAMNGCDRLLNT